jgi:hypothetical protein
MIAAQTPPTAAHENMNSSYSMECAPQNCLKCRSGYDYTTQSQLRPALLKRQRDPAEAFRETRPPDQPEAIHFFLWIDETDNKGERNRAENGEKSPKHQL